MKNIAETHIKEVILPFWKNLIDEEYGGFYGEVDYNLNVHKKNIKGCILNSRILWFFSNAVNICKDADSIRYADHAYEFLKKNCYDYSNGGVYWSVNYDGTPNDNCKHTYNQAFAVYALSAYFEMTKNMEALELAYEIFDVIETKCKDDLGYYESFTVDFKKNDNRKLTDGIKEIQPLKTMNTVIHIIEAYTEFYKVTKDNKVKRSLEDLLELFHQKIYNKKTNQLEVFFDNEYNSLAKMYSYGHDIEAAWLMDRALQVLNSERLNQLFKICTSNLVNRVLEEAFDKHLLYNEKRNDNIDKTRVWWVQAETVVSLVNEYQKTNDIEYRNKAEAVLDYIMEFMVDGREGSEWHWELDENDEDSKKKPMVEPWKCPYHNGRMCFELIRRDINV